VNALPSSNIFWIVPSSKSEADDFFRGDVGLSEPSVAGSRGDEAGEDDELDRSAMSNRLFWPTTPKTGVRI
jgi:hypothetical protein